MPEGYEDEFVEFSPDADKFPHLPTAGQYGPGFDNEADCEVIEYDFPAKDTPGYDKQGNPNDYAFIRIRVRSAEHGMVTVRHWESITANSGSRMPQWLANLGVELGENWRHRKADVLGAKCAVEVTDPNTGKDGRTFTGNLKDIIGV